LQALAGAGVVAVLVILPIKLRAEMYLAG